MRRIAALIIVLSTVAACSNPGLRSLRSSSDGPDEFRIKPVNPLEQPADYDTLPRPAPTQANLADRSALAEGAAAFGGTLGDPNAAIPASDGALVNHARRLGVLPGIRGDLAARDAQFRKRQARFGAIRIVPVDRYNQAYRREALDARAALRQWRRAGARTPSAPPVN